MGAVVGVGGTAVGVAGGFVAVGAALVAVGAVAVSAVLEEGFVVAVGSGSSFDEPLADEPLAGFVAVGEDSESAGSCDPEPSGSLASSGAAGGGLRTPAADGDEPPAVFAVVAAVEGAESLLSPEMPATKRPPVMVSVPPAMNAIAIALGLMTSLLVPLPAGSLEATSVRRAEGIGFERAALP